MLLSDSPGAPCARMTESTLGSAHMLDSWTGIGRVAVGMHRQGYDLQLTQYDERGWGATFYTKGMEHSPTSATGTGWERTPWHAVQGAAWIALLHASNTQGGTVQ